MLDRSFFLCITTHLSVKNDWKYFFISQTDRECFSIWLKKYKNRFDWNPFQFVLSKEHIQRGQGWYVNEISFYCTILVILTTLLWKKGKKKLLENFPTRLKCYLGDRLTVKDDNSIIFSNALQLFTRKFSLSLPEHKSILFDAIIPYEKAAPKRVSKIFENHSAMKKERIFPASQKFFYECLWKPWWKMLSS